MPQFRNGLSITPEPKSDHGGLYSNNCPIAVKNTHFRMSTYLAIYRTIWRGKSLTVEIFVSFSECESDILGFVLELER